MTNDKIFGDNKNVSQMTNARQIINRIDAVRRKNENAFK